MQSCPFRQKITKQHSVVLKQLSRFRNAWQGKTLQPSRIQTYCTQVDYITQLQSTYVYNCIQYSTQKMRQQILQVNKCIVQDMIKKLRHFSQLNKRSMKTTIEHEKKQLCQICSNKLRSVDVKMINEQLSDDATMRMALLKKIYNDLENQDGELFSKDDDEMFFKFLKSILVQKEEMVAMQTKEINDFLVQVTKSFNDLNFLADFTPGNYGSEGGFRSNYRQQLSRSINGTLKSKFHQRIYPWMQKVFDNVKKQIFKQKNKLNSTVSTQTEQQATNIQKKRNQYLLAAENKRQIQTLKAQILQSTITITELKSKLLVVEKQKKQLEEYYAKQVKQLMIEKKQIENKLRKTETDLFSLKQLNQEIVEVNKRLRNERKLSTPSKNSTNDINNINNKQAQHQLTQKPTPKNTNISTYEIQSQIQRKLKKKKSKINRLWSKINQTSSQRQLLIDNMQQQEQEQQQFIDNKNNDIMMSKTTGGEFINNNTSEELIAMSQGDEAFNVKPNRKVMKDMERKQIGPWSSNQKKQQKGQSKQQQPPASKSKEKRVSTMKPVRSQEKRNQSEVIKNQQQQINNNHSQGYSNNNLRKKSSLMRVNNLSNLSLISQHQNSSQLLGIKSSSSSIQMPSTNILKKLSIQKHPNNPLSQMRLPQDGLPIVKQQSFLVSRNSKTSNLQSKKRVFEFVPLENQVQYKQMREKMTQVTAMMKSKTIEMLKSNVRNNPHVEHGAASTGHNNYNSNNQSNSNFSLNNTNNNNNKLSHIYNNIHTQQQQQQHSSDQSQSQMGPIYGRSIFNQSKYPIRSSNRLLTNNSQHSDSMKKHGNEKELGESERKQDGLYMQRIHGSKWKAATLMDQVPVNDRHRVYQQLKKQSTIPDTLTFQHYQLMVKKLFAKLYRPLRRDNENHRHLHTRTSSSSQQQKMLLNLPKLQNTPNNKLPTTSSSNNSILNVNTMREKINLKGGMLSSKNLTYIKISPQKDHENAPQVKNVQTNPAIKPPITTPKYNQTFGMKELPIFFESQLAAYEYQQTSKYAKKPKKQQQDSTYSLKKLNQQQRKIIQSLYSILTQIKLKNHEVYHKVCSFLKYPYQTVTHGFEFINIGKDVSFEKWSSLLLGIYASKHQKDDKLTFGEFIKPFQEKIVQLIITVSSSSNA